MLPFLCASLISPLLLAKGVEIDNVEAVVNQEVILNSDIKRAQKDIQSRYQKTDKTLPDDLTLKRQILDKLITDRLQLQIAQQMGLSIADAQVEQTIQQVISEQNLTVTQYQAQLKQQGQSYNAFKDNIRDELTINEVRQVQVRRRINISEQEVEQMVERIEEQGEKTTKFRFNHILLKASNADSQAQQQLVEQKAKTLIEEINQGADITNLAMQHSQGPKAMEGGDWGWRSIDEIPTLFASVFDDMKSKKGDIIGPFRTNLGLHIIKIADKKGAESIMTVEVNARHILIKSNIILSDEKAEKLLNSYRQDILDEQNTFAELANANSQDPGSAIKGGDLGWADPNMYVPEFKELSLSLPIGEISKPFRTMHGWHILQVMERRKSDTTEEATKQKAYGILYKQRFPAEVYAWMNELRQEAYIKINNPNYIMDK